MSSATLLYFVTFSSIFGVIIGTSQVLTPCKIDDEDCILKSSEIAFTKLVAGIPELGINASDPLHHEKIEGSLPILKYTFTDATATGFRNCDVDDLILKMDQLSLRIILSCPDMVISGNYAINGRLALLPVLGSGKFKVVSTKYLIGVDLDLQEVRGDDDKIYLNIKKYKLQLKAMDGVKYDFENLFNGRKELADIVLKFANNNWKAVADFVQEPIFKANFNKITSNVNEYLATVPVDELFLS